MRRLFVGVVAICAATATIFLLGSCAPSPNGSSCEADSQCLGTSICVNNVCVPGQREEVTGHDDPTSPTPALGDVQGSTESPLNTPAVTRTDALEAAKFLDDGSPGASSDTFAFAVDTQGNEVDVVDVDKQTKVASLPVNHPNEIALVPDGIAVTGPNVLTFLPYDSFTPQTILTPNCDPRGIAFSDQTGMIIVICRQNTIDLVSLKTGAVSSVPTSSSPTQVNATGDGVRVLFPDVVTEYILTGNSLVTAGSFLVPGVVGIADSQDGRIHAAITQSGDVYNLSGAFGSPAKSFASGIQNPIALLARGDSLDVLSQDTLTSYDGVGRTVRNVILAPHATSVALPRSEPTPKTVRVTVTSNQPTTATVGAKSAQTPATFFVTPASTISVSVGSVAGFTLAGLTCAGITSSSPTATLTAPPIAFGCSARFNNACASPNLACGNVCVDPGNDVNACGGCGLACSNNHITTTMCTGGTCNGTCDAGFADCDANKQTNGCETNTGSDTSNCGGCGLTCSTNHMATDVCTGGTCNGTCAAGFADCNNNKQTDGCEVNLNADTGNCGACGHACTAGQACTNGTCTSQAFMFTCALPPGTRNASYTGAVTPSGGTPPYNNIQANGLPAGLSINSTTGAVTGVPTVSGFFNVFVQGADSHGTFANTTCPMQVNP